MIVTIPIALPSAANLREHWAAKHRRVKSQRDAVAWILGNRARPALPVVVMLTRVSARTLDDDNLRGAFKAVRDQLATWLGVDDADPRVRWDYDQRKGPPSVEVRVTLAPPVLGAQVALSGAA